MRAIVKTEQGIVLRDVAVPKPRPDEILVAVEIAGLCRTDFCVAQGFLPVKTGAVIGHEFTGTVAARGRRVRGLPIDTRVAVMPIISDANGHYVGAMMGVDCDGAYAEYAIVPAALAYPIPAALDARKAAYLEPVAAALAVLKAPIKACNKGVVLGQDRIATWTQRVLRAAGFRRTRTVSLATAKRLADNSLDFAIETLATSENLAELIRLVRPGGVIVLKSRQHVPVSLNIATVVKKGLTLVGTYYGSFSQGIEWLASGRLKVDDILGKVYSLEEGVSILRGHGPKNRNRKIFFRPGSS
jgi:L-iditol 2-dehydrogenase